MILYAIDILSMANIAEKIKNRMMSISFCYK